MNEENKKDWDINQWMDVAKTWVMSDEEVVTKMFTKNVENMIFECETIADIEKVDDYITHLKENGHPMKDIRHLWTQLHMVAEGIERNNFDKYGHTHDPKPKQR